jgi:CRP/FNR family transcriptional regulator, cyclic AMP receptor protein
MVTPGAMSHDLAVASRPPRRTIQAVRPAGRWMTNGSTSASAAATQSSPAVNRPVLPRPAASSEHRGWPAGPVVELDAALREQPGLPPTHTTRRIVTRVRDLARGPFDADAIIEDPSDSLGLVVLDGWIALGLDAGRAQISWLIGSGDLVRPWDMQELSLTDNPAWQALTPVRVALLDGHFRQHAAYVPGVARTLVTKLAATTHWLLAKSLIVSAPMIEERLLLLFALLAERWGRVTLEGVMLELPLTHDLLARMCGARRPSVTMSLRSLVDAGLLRCPHRGCWVLRRAIPAPASLRWGTNPCWRRYADAIGFVEWTDDAASRDQAA